MSSTKSSEAKKYNIDSMRNLNKKNNKITIHKENDDDDDDNHNNKNNNDDDDHNEPRKKSKEIGLSNDELDDLLL